MKAGQDVSGREVQGGIVGVGWRLKKCPVGFPKGLSTIAKGVGEPRALGQGLGTISILYVLRDATTFLCPSECNDDLPLSVTRALDLLYTSCQRLEVSPK